MKFEKIFDMVQITGQKNPKTQEEVLEYEIYSIMQRLLDCLYAFESGSRDAMKLPDQYELLGELKVDYKWLKGNVGCLEELRK